MGRHEFRESPPGTKRLLKYCIAFRLQICPAVDMPVDFIEAARGSKYKV